MATIGGWLLLEDGYYWRVVSTDNHTQALAKSDNQKEDVDLAAAINVFQLQLEHTCVILPSGISATPIIVMNIINCGAYSWWLPFLFGLCQMWRQFENDYYSSRNPFKLTDMHVP